MRLLRGILLVVALQAIPILANAVPQDPRVFVERQFNDHLSALHPRICGDCVDYCCDRSTQLEGPKEYVEDIKSMVASVPEGQGLGGCLSPCTQGLQKKLRVELAKFVGRFGAQYPQLGTYVLAQSQVVVPQLPGYQCSGDDRGNVKRKPKRSPNSGGDSVRALPPGSKPQPRTGRPKGEGFSLNDFERRNKIDQQNGDEFPFMNRGKLPQWSEIGKEAGSMFRQQIQSVRQDPIAMAAAAWRAVKVPSPMVNNPGMKAVPVLP